MIEALGAVPEPVEVLYNNPAVADSNLEFSARVAAWDAADESLKTFAHMAVAARVGCSWCLDVNYFQALNQHLDLSKASQVPRWRESDVFTALERDVLEYAEAMTDTPTERHRRAVGAPARAARPGGARRAHRVHRLRQPLDEGQHRARDHVAGLLRRVRDSAGPGVVSLCSARAGASQHARAQPGAARTAGAARPADHRRCPRRSSTSSVCRRRHRTRPTTGSGRGSRDSRPTTWPSCCCHARPCAPC